MIKMLKEHPELSHSSTINDLHKLINLHIVAALERLISHVALVCEFLKDISSMSMTFVAFQKCSRLFSQSTRHKD
jgi:hypothetical protein